MPTGSVYICTFPPPLPADPGDMRPKYLPALDPSGVLAVPPGVIRPASWSWSTKPKRVAARREKNGARGYDTVQNGAGVDCPHTERGADPIVVSTGS